MSASSPPPYAKLSGKIMWGDVYSDPRAPLPDLNFVVRTPSVRLGRSGFHGFEESEDFLALCTHKALSRHHATISWQQATDQWEILCKSKNGMVVDQAFYMKDERVELEHKSSIKIGPCALYFLLPTPEDDLTDLTPPPPPPQEQQPPHEPQEQQQPSEQEEGPQRRQPPEQQEQQQQPQREEEEQGQASPTLPQQQQSPPQQAVKDEAEEGKKATTTTTKLGTKTYAELVKEAFLSGAFDDAEKGDGVSSTELRDWIAANDDAWKNATADQLKLLSTGVQGALYRSKDYVKVETTSRQNRWRRLSAREDEGPPKKRPHLNPDPVAPPDNNPAGWPRAAAALYSSFVPPYVSGAQQQQQGPTTTTTQQQHQLFGAPFAADPTRPPAAPVGAQQPQQPQLPDQTLQQFQPTAPLAAPADAADTADVPRTNGDDDNNGAPPPPP